MKVRFAEFTLDSEARQLTGRGGEPIHLSPKAFDLLRLLVERRPSVLDKSYLHMQIWPATHVVDANLNVLVAEIRRALGDQPRSPRFIRTAHAVGYAFCGEAMDLDDRRSATAAGSARIWLLWNERAFVLAEGDNVVGRDPGCNIWLDAAGVSRRHARVAVAGDTVVIEDLGSKNGTLLDGSPISGPVSVGDGTLVELGSVELRLRIWARGQAPETERIRR